jgi:serine protease Do
MLTDVKDLDDAQKAKLGKSVPATGAFVAETTPGGPAGKAGMRAGDVITEVNNQKIAGAGDVVDFVSNQPIGARVLLHYVREGRPAQTQVALGELPDEDARQNAEQGQAKLGLALQTLTPQLAESLGLDPRTRGAVVAEVAPGGQAAAAGVREGDVILEIDRQPVPTADAAAAALGAPHKGGHLVRLATANGLKYITLGGP